MTPSRPVKPSELLLYTSPTGTVKVGVLVRDESVWLTQKALSDLFGVGVAAISKHLKNIFESGELEPAATVSKMEIVQAEGVRSVEREIEIYNLDAVISVGYRVNSHQATQFRIWATTVLRDFVIKGFVLDDERLKQGKTVFGKDYDANAPQTREFFASVQNKLHWAVTGQTAAERIAASADASKPNMGLTTWRQAPSGKVLKSDVTIAKNYLSESELTQLNTIVSAYLDLAENRAQRGLVTRMSEWANLLNRFLELSEYPVLADKGKVSALAAKLKAETEFETFRQRQDAEYVSDFDRMLAETKKLGAPAKPATPGKRKGKGH